MPFEIVRNDIVNMDVDAIVNTANHKPVIGSGTDAGIHHKAGKNLILARQKIGDIPVGSSALTPGFDLSAKYVIHTVSPRWQDGASGEEQLLKNCYESALELARENNCESIAFPLLATGNNGFPKALALEIAIGVFSKFLLENDMHIYLVVFGREAFTLSEKLFHSVKSYIDEKYVETKTVDEYDILCENGSDDYETDICFMPAPRRDLPEELFPCASVSFGMSAQKALPKSMDSLEDMLKNLDAGFSETLLKLIDKTGKKDSEIYKKANVDRKLFSKIRNNPNYKPSKSTALAFAIALELNLEETKEFIAKAGYALSHSSQFDIIIEFFIANNDYDMFRINETLFAFDQNLLGA